MLCSHDALLQLGKLSRHSRVKLHFFRLANSHLYKYTFLCSPSDECGWCVDPTKRCKSSSSGFAFQIGRKQQGLQGNFNWGIMQFSSVVCQIRVTNAFSIIYRKDSGTLLALCFCHSNFRSYSSKSADSSINAYLSVAYKLIKHQADIIAL